MIQLVLDILSVISPLFSHIRLKYSQYIQYSLELTGKIISDLSKSSSYLSKISIRAGKGGVLSYNDSNQLAHELMSGKGVTENEYLMKLCIKDMSITQYYEKMEDIVEDGE